MNSIKQIIAIVLVAIMVSTTVLANNIVEQIEVIFNSIKVTVNGEAVDTETILYNGTTYVQLRKISEITGSTVTYDNDTKTANIVSQSLDIDEEQERLEEEANAYTEEQERLEEEAIAYEEMNVQDEPQENMDRQELNKWKDLIEETKREESYTAEMNEREKERIEALSSIKREMELEMIESIKNSSITDLTIDFESGEEAGYDYVTEEQKAIANQEMSSINIRYKQEVNEAIRSNKTLGMLYFNRETGKCVKFVTNMAGKGEKYYDDNYEVRKILYSTKNIQDANGEWVMYMEVSYILESDTSADQPAGSMWKYIEYQGNYIVK